MLVYVAELRLIRSPDMQQFVAEDALEQMLLCIAGCARHAGALTLPTIPKGKPDPGAFLLAFSGGDLVEALENDGTMYMLMAAIRFAAARAGAADETS